MKIVIVGGGRAAASAAAAAREVNGTARIVLIGAEPVLPYFRPRLSHSLGENLKASSILIHGRDWYAERDIEVRTGTEVRGADATRRTVRLDDGTEMEWDALVLATGARPFVPSVPGADRPGVFSLRSLADRDAITAAAQSGERAAIIGGGVLGLEAAWALRRAGMAVTVLERGPHLLGRMLDAGGAEFLGRIVEEKGVRPLYGASSESVVGPSGDPEDEQEAVARVNLADGSSVDTDLLVFSTGIRCETALGEELGIDCGRGIPVDAAMRTAIPGVYACGDVAEFDGTVVGAWEVADRQGAVAGANAAGAEDRSYSVPAPTRTLMVMGTRVFSAGQTDGGDDEVVGDCDAAAGVYRRFWLEDGRLVGAVLIGDTDGSQRIKEAIDAGTVLKDRDIQSASSLLATLR